MTLYEKFEHVVIFVLSAIIAFIVVASVWALMREVVNRLVLGAFDTLDYAAFQVVFGMIFTVVIALEFKRSLLVATERSFGVLQVRTIVLIALLAIARKFIILDLGETEPARLPPSRARLLRSEQSTGWCAIRTGAKSPVLKMPKAINEPKRFRSTCFINLCRTHHLNCLAEIFYHAERCAGRFAEPRAVASRGDLAAFEQSTITVFNATRDSASPSRQPSV